MSHRLKLIHSREHWKKKESDRYKKAAKEAIEERRAERQRQLPQPVHNKADLVYIALQLFTVARIGYRAVSRVLRVRSPYLGIANAPCAQTIINWVTRLSIVNIQKAAELTLSLHKFSNSGPFRAVFSGTRADFSNRSIAHPM